MAKSPKANQGTKSATARTAVYLRVSTEEQKHDSQRSEIEAWAKRQRLTPTALRWFEDKATGNTLNRPAFGNLQTAIAKGQIDTVVIYRLDRLSRKMLEGLNTLAKWCEQGVRVVVVTQDLDLEGTVGQIVASVLLGVAEIEQQGRKERQASGIAAAKKRGVYSQGKGRPKGSTKAKPARAKELESQGLKPAEIARAMGIHRDTVYEYLKQAG